MQPAAALCPLLLLSLALPAPAQAGVVLEQASDVDGATAQPPATLAPLNANTVVGASGASATTSAPIRLAGPPASVLKVVHGTVPQDVHITVLSRSGFGSPADSVTVSLAGASVVVTQSNPLPRSTATVDLGTTSDLTVTASGLCIGTCTLGMEVRIDPDGAGINPVLAYPYTLVVT